MTLLKKSGLSMYLLLVFFSSNINAEANKTPDNWEVPVEYLKTKSPLEKSTQSIDLGKALFRTHCQSCHGYWGEGDGIIGLSLNNRPANLLKLSGKQTAGAFAWKISQGRNDMPSFRTVLSDTDTWSIVHFISSLESKKVAGNKPIVVRLCARCHGMAGKAYYEGWPDLPEMTQKELEDKLFAHRDGVIKDSTMSKVTFDLSDEEIREAAVYYSSLSKKNH